MSTVILTLHVTMPHAKCAHSQTCASADSAVTDGTKVSLVLIFISHILIIFSVAFTVLSSTGVRGIRTIRVANLIDAHCERRVAERRVL